MKKSTILFLVGIILICGLLYSIFILDSSEVKYNECQFLEKNQISKTDEIRIYGLEENSYTITKSGEEIFLVNAPEIELSVAYLTATWDRLIGLEASNSIETSMSDAEAGFDCPEFYIDYCRKGEVVASLCIGHYSAIRDAYFSKRLDTESGVYLIDSEMINMIMNAKQEFYLKNILDFWSEDDYDRLTSVEVKSRDENFENIKIEADKTWFHMSKPINYICDYKNLKSAFLDKIMRLKGTELVSNISNQTMGFNDPVYTITYIYDDEEINVLIGNSENGMSYIRRTDQELVFRINDEELNFLKLDYEDYIGESCYSRYINFVDSFSIEYQEVAEKFEIENAEDYSDKWLAIHNGKTYPYEKFINLFNAVMGVSRKEFLYKTQEETDLEKRVTIQVKLKSGDQDIVQFMKIGTREYKAVINGECYFTVSEASVENILNILKSTIS